MCGNEAVVRDKYEDETQIEQKQQEYGFESRTPVIEQIEGTTYTFDTETCLLMFKKFNAVYGSGFADD
jgi:hypothetical protein